MIPAPLEVDAAMKKVGRGKLTTIDSLRRALAKKHGTTIACPITTGIFAWIAAHAADEGESEGRKRITPYWRTLKTGGELNAKYPGGIKNLRARLAAEGHRSRRQRQALLRRRLRASGGRTVAVSACFAPCAACSAVGRRSVSSRSVSTNRAAAGESTFPLRSTTP